MVKKRVDDRVKRFVEEGVRSEQRSLIVLVGDHGKDQVVNLHQMLARARVAARPSVLWCYKKELGFSTHRKKRMKQIKKQVARGLHDATTDEPFELFISQTRIRWCYYRDTQKILGSTYGCLVLQDFEALTPNLLARTIETVEGGGLVVLLLRTVNSLRQLYAQTMDVHARFRGAGAHSNADLVPRFNERFILSLADCARCLVLDDELNVLPISKKHVKRFDAVPEDDEESSRQKERREVAELASSLKDVPPAGELVALARTPDQARAILAFIDSLAERRARSVTTLTAPRGRGKSAALGLCLAAAVATGYASIFVTAPAVDNVATVFEFLLKGLEALHYDEKTDYEVLKHKTESGVDVPARVDVFQSNDSGPTTRQVVQYVSPSDSHRLAHAELVIVDEAAALPLPVVEKLLGPYVVFLASTVTGYEGTGRALQLKLLAKLRKAHARRAVTDAATQAASTVEGNSQQKKGQQKVHEQRWAKASEAAKSSVTKSTLRELTLDAPVRYASGDAVEAWLHRALCLDSPTKSVYALKKGLPAPVHCSLYEVNRDALFSYHALSERFLQRVMALYTAAHYKNSPNDLQLLSDAPAHRLFVLLGPVDEEASAGELPDILVVVQVALEGAIQQEAVKASLARGERGAGDLVPWTLAQQFCDPGFAKLSGARIVRVATHPDAQRVGYGTRALKLLISYLEGELDEREEDDSSSSSDDDEEPSSLRTESLQPRKKMPPLLAPVGATQPPSLQWIAASYGLTEGLFEYWSREGLRPCYVRQTANDVTGEHTTICLREIANAEGVARGWSDAFVDDFRKRCATLLGLPCFVSFPPALSLGLLGARDTNSALHRRVFSSTDSEGIADASELAAHFTAHDLQRLDLYAKQMVDHHLVADLLPALGQLCFRGRLDVKLSLLQAAIVLGLALQRKEIGTIARDLDLPTSQALALYNKAIRKFAAAIRKVREAHVRDVELGLTDEREASERAYMSRLEPADDAKVAPVQAPVSNETGVSLLDALEAATPDYAIDDAKAQRLGTAAGAAPASGALVQVAGKRKPDETPVPSSKKKLKKSSKKKKRRDS